MIDVDVDAKQMDEKRRNFSAQRGSEAIKNRDLSGELTKDFSGKSNGSLKENVVERLFTFFGVCVLV